MKAPDWRRTIRRPAALGKMGVKRLRAWMIALGSVVLVVGLTLAGAFDGLSLEALARHHARLAAIVAQRPMLAGAAFVALYVAVVAFSVPGTVLLTLSGGLLFGAVAGTLLTVLAATTGATIVFLLARRIFGADALDRLGPRATRIAEGIRRDSVSYLLVLRLVPLVPFVLVNLVPAFCGVRLRVFAATTMAGIAPATAVYSLAGAGLSDVLAGGAFEIGDVLTPTVLWALGGLAALALLAIPLRRRFSPDGS